MRVITGKARGKTLKAPKGMKTRPTTDRVKEALFNILGPNMEKTRFLDLFAGSGGMGIEALSRGAEVAVFVEKDSAALGAIKENLTATGLLGQARVCRGDVLIILEALASQGEIFDYIFLDPPYLHEFEQPVLSRIHELQLLAGDGLVIVESSKRESLPDRVGSLERFRSEKYGETILTFYQRVI